MSTASEVVTILQRVVQRVDKGSDNYNVALRMVQARIEVEEKYQSMLKQIIPQQFDDKDPITKNFITELQNEIDQHATFSKELKDVIYKSASTYSQTMKDKRDRIHKAIKQQLSALQKVISDREKAANEVEQLKAKLPQMQGSNVEKQNNKINKANIELSKKIKAENDTTMKLASSSIPTIHRDFTDFDSTRLTKFQKMTVDFEKAKLKLNTEINKGLDVFIHKMNNFDAKDRSKRYIERVFDPSAELVEEEDQDLMAVAISDYRSDEPTDLQFERGDQIHILVQHSSGWWEGEANGKRGYFPKTFVQLPGEHNSGKDPIGAVFLCIKDYQQDKRLGDIELLSGDLVYVDFVQKGKCSGTNLRIKKRGYFPLANLEQRI
ncbi:Variant SH3 domain containing protein [Histomonas meleagridis]|uniref:Variant SH3 domain containing protein n=1 Tax=Histomonas meleagridis TaxID=135588 RepID=UPI003559D1D0|nr:Variant SH3 domain containing protein [Histomonas meleagridis]KAH0802834.1 Variant SH3 domain containing protein [Histomonas meleagridis]